MATSQQSRFHTEAGDTTSIASKDVSKSLYFFLIYLTRRVQLDIRNLTLSIGNREILNGVDLKLQYGVHYIVVGRNGVGKSSAPHLCP